MNPTHGSAVRAWMLAQGFEPSKSLGQNFLVDANLRDRILDLSGAGPGDHVLEVGPGLGALTGALLDRGSAVTAIEIDQRLADFLREAHSGRPGFTLIHRDALDVDYPALLEGGINRLVANLPYSVGSRILFELAGQARRPLSMTVTVQREVGERLVAPVNHDDYGLLSVWMQTFYRIRVAKILPASCFLPPPRVESAAVQLERLDAPRCGAVAVDRYRALLKHCFEHRRKQLGALLRKAPPGLRLEPEGFAALGLDPRARPETLGPEEFARLAAACG